MPFGHKNMTEGVGDALGAAGSFGIVATFGMDGDFGIISDEATFIPPVTGDFLTTRASEPILTRASENITWR